MSVVFPLGDLGLPVPSNWHATTFGAICDANEGEIQTGPFGSQLHKSDYARVGTPVVMPQDLIDGTISTQNVARVEDSHVVRLSRHQLREGDIIYSRRGDVTRFAVVTPREVGWLCGTGCIRIRPDSPKLSADYLRFYLRHIAVKDWLVRNAKGATMPNLNTKILRALPVHVPSLSEQNRIAVILDTSDGIRSKRFKVIRLTEKFLRSTFLDMFGDPVTNPNSLDQVDLGNVVEFVSGGTPSKMNPAYWEGEFPWVSPKDMKVVEINDAMDHVTDLAFEETTLKRIPVDSILIVIRGMILAHTVPISVNRRSVAINQDMKALLPSDDFRAEFVLWALRSQHNLILSRVATAAHGTKRIEVSELKALKIPVVSLAEQDAFLKACKNHRHLVENARHSVDDADDLFNSLVQRAFKGEL